MDTLHRATAHRRSPDAWEEHVTYHDEGDQDLPDHNQVAGQVAGPETDLAELLLQMRDAGSLTPEEAKFLGEVYLVSGGDQKDAARRLGLSHAATRQRVSRLRSRLCSAVAAEVAAVGDSMALAS
ncbi:hypothetical protein [Nocardioides limicola]|uniref:hypothetical protein n=1 Tax=Nocardioides limicola TaxID=2803368 RepID=UPI00193C1885|nr:hypothetical protein [Nocardioides sp. DJM-14]